GVGAALSPAQLIRSLALPNTSKITNAFDADARLLTTRLRTSSGTLLDSSDYGYNLASQRTNLTRADSSTVAYTYDKIGQLLVANGSDSGDYRAYTYDAAWNLTTRTNFLGETAPDAFSVDNLNQLTNLVVTDEGPDDPPNHDFTYDQNGN